MMGFTLLCEAISNRQLVGFSYKSERWRVEPYLIGYTAFGDTILNGWVVKHRQHLGWQQFHVPLIVNVRLSKTRFLRARPGYDPYDGTVAQVISRFENACSPAETG